MSPKIGLTLFLSENKVVGLKKRVPQHMLLQLAANVAKNPYRAAKQFYIRWTLRKKEK